MSELAGAAPSPALPGSARAWWMAVRPATLGAAAVPVFVGTACAFAGEGVRWGPALAALIGALLLQIGANFANDVFDYEKGADTSERLGPTRTVQAGLLTPRQMRHGMLVVFGLALSCGVYLTGVAGPAIIVIGLLSIASAIAYTGGPYPLGYHGLGDVFVMIFFGFVAVCGTAFVQTGRVPELSVWAAVPVGALATNILVVNNVRDRETDVRAGKRTLAVRFGRKAGIAQYAVLLGLSYLVPASLVLSGRLALTVLLPLLTLPAGILLLRNLMRDHGAPLNQTLVGTAKLLVIFGVLFALGIASSGHIPT
ncbi:MAG TPA: 1,4-dihydroxy-2-naphthoate polyprenyltransferase [Polyangiaceae bacterium]|nr:1,4-dihydroxy-2-naphthoate polyprenyltransferase [Polyangiaceae bacterium]